MKKKNKISEQIKVAEIAATSQVEAAKIASRGQIISTAIKTIGAIIILAITILLSQTHPAMEKKRIKTNQSSTAKNK